MLFPQMKVRTPDAIPEKHSLVAFLAPDLVKRYETDRAVAATLNELIDNLAREERIWRAQADLAAWEASYEPAADLMRRFTPRGEKPDIEKLLRIPAFVEARDALAQKVEDVRFANAEKARTHFRVQLESFFAALRSESRP
jgi:hypothetical protein